MSKKIKIIVIILCVLILFIAFSVYIFVTPRELLPTPLSNFVGMFDKKYTQADNTYKPDIATIIYHPADFSENIYNDEDFVELMNLYALEYIDGDIAYKLSKDNLESIGGDLAVFFYDYFTNIRNGDADKYNSYFDNRAFELREKAKDFTMQQIYEISISPLQIEPELDKEEYSWVYESGITPIFVDVSYKIRKNNGTFRLGVNSDTAKPQLYILYKKDKTYKIINIVDYAPIYL